MAWASAVGHETQQRLTRIAGCDKGPSHSGAGLRPVSECYYCLMFLNNGTSAYPEAVREGWYFIA